MNQICCLEFKDGSKEELLPGMKPDFPYISSYFDLDRQLMGPFAPWHWHREVELFYIESGALEYHIPKGCLEFPAGTGGLLNSNVLHMTKASQRSTIQLLHIFDTTLISGPVGSRIEQQYILPFTTAPQIGIAPLRPGDPEQDAILELLRQSFRLSPDEYAYEFKLRAALSEIWYRILALQAPLLEQKENDDKTNDKLKTMILYIHEHFPEKISIADICASAFISERECFRTFRECLRTTPAEYLKNYRLQQACGLLAQGSESITAISQSCGLGSSSYFGKTFREHTGYPPSEYRRRWQDRDTKGQ